MTNNKIKIPNDNNFMFYYVLRAANKAQKRLTNVAIFFSEKRRFKLCLKIVTFALKADKISAGKNKK